MYTVNRNSLSHLLYKLSIGAATAAHLNSCYGAGPIQNPVVADTFFIDSALKTALKCDTPLSNFSA
jgi:hypothetical protein